MSDWLSAYVAAYPQESADKIKALESENEQLRVKVNKWVSVEDRLPEKYVTVRVWPTKGNDDAMQSMDRGSIQDDGWNVENWQSIFSHPVTHWMPLPEPPKGE